MSDKQFYAVELSHNVGAILIVTVDTFHPGTAHKMSAVEEEAIWCYCTVDVVSWAGTHCMGRRSIANRDFAEVRSEDWGAQAPVHFHAEQIYHEFIPALPSLDANKPN